MGDSDRSPTPEAGGGGDGERLHIARNGRAGSPCEDLPGRSPSPCYRRYSDSTPTRSPSPVLLADGYDDLEVRSSRKTKSVSFHSHTNWKSDRKIQSGKCLSGARGGGTEVVIVLQGVPERSWANVW